ncbi:glycosyltransferase family 4 protein [Allopusillimonas ginsengisoli]|uniref:glycosyltransferase family 4 protein n=1 Tax=Allopusillimonas ginsengisoli TaxID=453575 RepID=UPI001AD9DE12|nr:glycosyltransferase family 4 protein [Allopusillimonas ginsengisoli]
MNEQRALAEIDLSLVSKLKSAKNGPAILYVGSLIKSKRPMDLLLSFRDVLLDVNIHPDTQLWFVGAGPELPELERRAHEMCISSNVKFFGKIFEGVGNYFSAADLVVVPGLGGLVINHAMIFGKPVVSRPADGTERDLVIDGETGFLLNDYDISNLTHAIVKSLHSEKLIYMSEQARRLVAETWNMKTMLLKVHECVAYAENNDSDLL